MRHKPIVLTIDSILAILKDYMKPEDLPEDAVAQSLMINPSEKNKIAIVADSPSWPIGAEPLLVNFDIRRIFGAS